MIELYPAILVTRFEVKKWMLALISAKVVDLFLMIWMAILINAQRKEYIANYVWLKKTLVQKPSKKLKKNTS